MNCFKEGCKPPFTLFWPSSCSQGLCERSTNKQSRGASRQSFIWSTTDSSEVTNTRTLYHLREEFEVRRSNHSATTRSKLFIKKKTSTQSTSCVVIMISIRPPKGILEYLNTCYVRGHSLKWMVVAGGGGPRNISAGFWSPWGLIYKDTAVRLRPHPNRFSRVKVIILLRFLCRNPPCKH